MESMVGNSSSKDVVMRAWQEFGTRDPQRIAAVFTDDAEWLAPAGNAVARVCGTHHLVGKERIVQFLAHEFPALITGVTVVFGAVLADGDTVVVEERMRGRLANGRQ